ncbi:MAG: hypothetical protein FJ220_07205 [Kiritimatiellaceae bacterium]|nr:hypothetical protein [Kiritimatiellaceae bacterium]
MKIAKHISLALFVIFSTAIYAFTEEFPPVAVAEDPTKLFWENIFFLIIDYLWAVYLFLCCGAIKLSAFCALKFPKTCVEVSFLIVFGFLA